MFQNNTFRILNFRSIMENNLNLVWQNVVYGENSIIPEQRWGHRLVKINDHQLLLFGGFGGKHSDEGEYLNDLWIFNAHSHQWRQLETKGTYPEPRSNYTLHYNQIDNEVIIFGGGSASKQRFNSLCILSLNTLTWRKVTPTETLAAPWERTYHSGQFLYPYLVVFGGEGVANMDLDDTWAYNILTNQWKQLQFEAGVKASRRRFHGSALINNQMFIIGGCYGNYLLLGDIYKVNLTNLTEKNQYNGFKWEIVATNSKALERWGHSCDVFKGKVYICGGRISLTNDSNELLELDPSTNILREVSVSNSNSPKPRRRHASAIIGHSLLIFGGYDGQYLKDFNFITLSQNMQIPKISLPEVLSSQAFYKKMNFYESHIASDLTIVLKRGNAVIGKVRSCRQELQKYEFFKNLLHYNNEEVLTIELPAFSNLLTFCCMHIIMMGQELILSKDFDFEFLGQLALTFEYYCCFSQMAPIEQYLISRLTSQSSLKMLELSILLSFPILQHKSAKICLKNCYNGSNENDLFSLISEQKDGDVQKLPLYKGKAFETENMNAKKMQIFSSVLQNLRFDLEQANLRDHNTNFLSRTAAKLKNLFMKTESQGSRKKIEIQQIPNKGSHKVGCFAKVIYFFASFCSSDPNEQQNNE